MKRIALVIVLIGAIFITARANVKHIVWYKQARLSKVVVALSGISVDEARTVCDDQFLSEILRREGRAVSVKKLRNMVKFTAGTDVGSIQLILSSSNPSDVTMARDIALHLTEHKPAVTLLRENSIGPSLQSSMGHKLVLRGFGVINLPLVILVVVTVLAYMVGKESSIVSSGAGHQSRMRGPSVGGGSA